MLYTTLKVIERINQKHHQGKSDEFLKGYFECAEIVRLSLTKNTQYNLEYQNKKLSKELEHFKDLYRKACLVIDNHREDLLTLKARLDKMEMVKISIDIKPTNQLKEYSIVAPTGERFNIVTNIEENVLFSISKDFALKYSFKDTNDCKIKLVNYINSKNDAGIYAFGNFKKARRKLKLLKKEHEIN